MSADNIPVSDGHAAMPSSDLKIDYVEFVAGDLKKAQAFYGAVFGWKFNDWGADYTDCHDGRLTGGFVRGETPAPRSALVVIYAADLEAAEARITTAGGKVTARLDFPGGRRFHFKDPNGLELGVWSDRRADGTKIEL